MTVIIPHPTEELNLINFQKELISALYKEGRILYAERPLWIDFSEQEELKTVSKSIQSVSFGKLKLSDKSIFIPVQIKTSESIVDSKLTLVNIYKGQSFTDKDKKLIGQKKQPVNQLKIFRLGLVQAEGPHAKSISKSAWCKLHHTASTVK